jgi:hypothetical protein
MPLLTAAGYTVGEDIFIAFSPERVDPGNPVYNTRNTPKVVGGITPACTELATALYQSCIETIVPVSSTETAELVKLLENTFRSVNIAMANEMAIVCDKLGVNVWEVIDAAATKPFGFMKFTPGPGIGGHCIPLDPHYLAWKMRTLNYKTRFIDLASEINSQMPAFVVNKVAQALNAERKPVKTVRHGVTLVDDYAWLRTAKPEAVLAKPELLEAPIRRHLEAEERYAAALLAPNKALEQRLVEEMRGRTSANDDTVPEANGPFEYYSRYDKGAQRKLHCRRPRGGGPEEIILDENKLAQGRRDYSLDETAVSHDHKRIAYSFDADGSERNTLKVRDLATGRDLPDTISEVRGGAVWSADSIVLNRLMPPPPGHGTRSWEPRRIVRVLPSMT